MQRRGATRWLPRRGAVAVLLVIATGCGDASVTINLDPALPGPVVTEPVATEPVDTEQAVTGRVTTGNGRFSIELPEGFRAVPNDATDMEGLIDGAEIDEAGRASLLAWLTQQGKANFVLFAAEFNTGDDFTDNINVIERDNDGTTPEEVLTILESNYATAGVDILEIGRRDDLDWPAIAAVVRVPVDNQYLSTTHQLYLFAEAHSFEVSITISDVDSTETVDHVESTFGSIQLAD